MRGGFGSIRIDRERAVRAAALAGLVVLGISTLPGLLKTPEPPPVPADVGFRPGELTRFAARPDPKEIARRKADGQKLRWARRRKEHEAERRKEREAVRKRQALKRKSFHEKRASKQPNGKDSGSVSGTGSGAATVPPTASAPSPPAYSPPSASVPTAPVPSAPAPAPSPSPQPADGSQEFAPR